MRNKKIKLYASAVLGALSCLSSLQINANENEKQNLLKEKMLSPDSTMINSGIKQNSQIIAPITPTPGMNIPNRVGPVVPAKFPTLPPAAKATNNEIASKSQSSSKSSSLGGFWKFILGLGLGIGGTLAIKKLIFRNSATGALDVDGYLWICVQLTCGYRSKDSDPHDCRKDNKKYEDIIVELPYGAEHAEYGKEYTSLFRALQILYNKIMDSEEFRNLTFKEEEDVSSELKRKQEVLRSIKNILGIPEMYYGNNKYYWCLSDNEHVYAGMQEGSEIKTNGKLVSDVYEEPNFIYTAKFKKQNGEITLEDFKISKDEDNTSILSDSEDDDDE